jgi:hypothetical protein
MSEDFTNTSFDSKHTKELLNSLEVITVLNKTHVIVVAVSKDRTKNKINRISCRKGLYLGGYLYDSQSDSYLVDCADYLNLGSIPISFKIKTKAKSNWENWMPIPENVLNKHFTSMQKKEFKNFKSHFNSDEFEIQFLQTIDAN